MEVSVSVTSCTLVSWKLSVFPAVSVPIPCSLPASTQSLMKGLAANQEPLHSSISVFIRVLASSQMRELKAKCIQLTKCQMLIFNMTDQEKVVFLSESGIFAK